MRRIHGKPMEPILVERCHLGEITHSLGIRHDHVGIYTLDKGEEGVHLSFFPARPGYRRSVLDGGWVGLVECSAKSQGPLFSFFSFFLTVK